MKLSLATADDLREFYGTYPTMRAVTVKKDGKVVIVIGLVFEPIVNRFFSEHRSLSRKEMSWFWRAAKMAMRFVRESRKPVISIAQHDHGHKNLTRLGFERLGDDIYLWPG